MSAQDVLRVEQRVGIRSEGSNNNKVEATFLFEKGARAVLCLSCAAVRHLSNAVPCPIESPSGSQVALYYVRVKSTNVYKKIPVCWGDGFVALPIPREMPALIVMVHHYQVEVVETESETEIVIRAEGADHPAGNRRRVGPLGGEEAAGAGLNASRANHPAAMWGNPSRLDDPDEEDDGGLDGDGLRQADGRRRRATDCDEVALDWVMRVMVDSADPSMVITYEMMRMICDLRDDMMRMISNKKARANLGGGVSDDDADKGKNADEKGKGDGKTEKKDD